MNPFYTTTSDFTPMTSALAVTTSDASDLAPPSGPARPTRAVLIGGAGTVKVTMADGSTPTITIPATACGVLIYLAVNRIWATGTTATNIVAFY